MAVSKRSPIFWQSDLDELRLPAQAMSDAFGVEVMDGDSDNVLVLKNPKGNTALNYTLPEGSCKVIGTIAHEERSSFYIALWSSGQDHRIIRYSELTRSLTTVIEYDFKWAPYMYVNGFATYVPSTGTDILCFTDSTNEIWQIDVMKGINRSNGDYINGYPQVIDQKELTLIKSPPLTPCSAVFGEDPSRKVNSLQGKTFEFRARYKYDDFTYSVYGPTSKVYASEWLRENGLFTTGPYDEESEDPHNYLTVSVASGLSSCTEIDIIARDSNLSEWKKVKSMPNNPSVSTLSFDFYNDGNYAVANPQDTEQPYHDVPLSASAVTRAGGRVVAGDVVRGRSSVGYTQGDIGDKVRVSPRYIQREDKSLAKKHVLERVTGVAFGIRVLSDDPQWAGDPRDIYYPYVEGQQVITSFSLTNSQGASQSVYIEENVLFGDTNSSVHARIVDKLNARKVFGYKIYAGTNDNWPAVYPQIFMQLADAAGVFTLTLMDTVVTPGVYDRGSAYETHGPTLKSGATSEIAICHSDKFGRRVSSQKLDDGEIYVKHLAERSENWEKNGRVKVNLVNEMTPPIWAEKWWLEYSGTKSIDDSWEFIAWNAEKPRNKVVKERLTDPGDKSVVEEVQRNLNTTESRVVYVNLGSLMGKELSYNESGGAKINYAYLDGDRIRVKSKEVSGVDTPMDQYVDLKILDVQYLVADEERNPIYNATGSDLEKFKTTGWFALVESSDDKGFNLADLSSWTGAVAEIYRPKKEFENSLFFGTGEVFGISNPGLPTRSYQGNVRSQSDSVSISVSSYASNYITLSTSSNSRPEIACGDVVNINNLLGANGVEVKNVVLESDGTNLVWRLYFDQADVAWEPGGSPTTVTLTNPDSAAVELEVGDYWFKPRWMESLLSKGGWNDFVTGADSYKSLIEVEDKRVNDFVGLPSFSKGVANAHTENPTQAKMGNALMFGGVFFDNSFTNRMNVFTPLEVNMEILDASHGEIRLLHFDGKRLVVFKENRVCWIPVSEEVIETADGGAIMTSNSKFLGTEQPYAQPYGCCNNPESVVTFGGNFWFCDIRRGVFVRRSEAGLTAISDAGISKTIEQLSKGVERFSSSLKIAGGYDQFKRSVYWSVQEHSSAPILIGGIRTDLELFQVNDDETTVSFPIAPKVVGADTPEINGGKTFLGTETRTWSQITENWEDWGVGGVDLDQVMERGFLAFDSVEELQSSGSTPITLRVFTEGTKTSVSATYNFRTGQIEIPSSPTVPGSPTARKGDDSVGQSVTVSYNESADKWQGKWPFKPEFMHSMNGRFFSFKDGRTWEHATNSNRSNYYGTQYSPFFEVVFNDLPSFTKRAMALSVEGTHPWDVQVSTDLNSTSVNSSVFDKEEGTWYAQMLFTSDVVSDGNSIGLGVVDSISGADITLTLPILNVMGIHPGLLLYGPSGQISGTISSFTDDTITMSTSAISALSPGDLVRAVYPSKSSGDRIRGKYFKAKFTLPDTYNNLDSRVNFVNLEYEESKAHHGSASQAE